MMNLDINTDGVVRFANQLEKMRKSALPAAVRGALNSAAFDVKKNTMPASAQRAFITRAPNFFKANSGVEMASGWDINGMKATVGFTGKSTNKSDQAVDDLEQQEWGGTIANRSFIPMNPARGGDFKKRVTPSNRIGRINNVVNSNTIEGKTPKQKFRHAAIKAGRGGFVLGNNDKKTLFKVVSIREDSINLKPLFSFRHGRKVRISKTGFMGKAATESGGKLNEFFYAEAQRQIERFYK